jgi:hypothetical protein
VGWFSSAGLDVSDGTESDELLWGEGVVDVWMGGPEFRNESWMIDGKWFDGPSRGIQVSKQTEIPVRIATKKCDGVGLDQTCDKCDG